MTTITSSVKRHTLLAIVALLLCLTPATVGATVPTNIGFGWGITRTVLAIWVLR